jgi:hypothetical protein
MAMRLLLSCTAVAAAAALSFAVWSSPAQATANNPFAGEWCGTFELVGDEDPAVVGTMEWTISPAGRISGTFLNTTLGIPGTMAGHVDSDGTLHLNPNIYGAGPGGEGGNGEHHAGTAVITEDGTLIGETTGVWHGGYSVTAILERCD